MGITNEHFAEEQTQVSVTYHAAFSFYCWPGVFCCCLFACTLTQPLNKPDDGSAKPSSTLTATLVWGAESPQPSETIFVNAQTQTKAVALGTIFPTSAGYQTPNPSIQSSISGTPKTQTRTLTATFPLARSATRTSVFFRSRTPTRPFVQRTTTSTMTRTTTITATPTVTHTATPTHTASPTHTATFTATPTATATPNYVYFSAPASDGAVKDIWMAGLYDSVSSSQVLLYHNDAGDSLLGDIASDGSAIIYEGVCGDPASNGLCWLDISTSPVPAPVQLANLPPGVNHSPSFSPDGTWIVFSNELDGNADLYLLNLTDSAALPIQLTSGSGMDTQPDWSSPGIVFIRDGDPMLIDFASGFPPAAVLEPVPLFTSPEQESDPRVSQNGTMLAFSRLVDGDWEIFTYDFAGSTFTQLTNNNADDRQPAWSPADDELLMISDRDVTGVFQLYRLNASGSEQRRVLNSLSNEGFPLWLP